MDYDYGDLIWGEIGFIHHLQRGRERERESTKKELEQIIGSKDVININIPDSSFSAAAHFKLDSIDRTATDTLTVLPF